MSDGHDERRNPDEELEQAATAPATDPPEAGSRSTSGDVLSLIEDVERHLTRIRDVHRIGHLQSPAQEGALGRPSDIYWRCGIPVQKLGVSSYLIES